MKIVLVTGTRERLTVDNAPQGATQQKTEDKRNDEMAFGKANQTNGQGLSRAAGGGRRTGLSHLMGEATMGGRRRANIPYGKTRLKILSTEQAKMSDSLVIEFEIVAVDPANEAAKDKVGTKCSKVFKFGGDKVPQKTARTAEWCRFLVNVAGVADLDALEAAGVDVFDVIDKSCLHESEEGAQPLRGEYVDVLTTDTGKRTKPSADGKYAGGDAIDDHDFAPVNTLFTPHTALPASEAA